MLFPNRLHHCSLAIRNAKKKTELLLRDLASLANMEVTDTSK